MNTQSPTTEAGGWDLNTPEDTAIVFLEDYAGRIPLDVYEDLQTDIAQLVTDEREWGEAARAEGRREAVREIRKRVNADPAMHFRRWVRERAGVILDEVEAGS